MPYIVDNAWGAPFHRARTSASWAAMRSSTAWTRSPASPTCGLIIGKEEPMVAIRRALGIHGARYGTLSSHGKAALVGYDPGKEALVGALAALRSPSGASGGAAAGARRPADDRPGGIRTSAGSAQNWLVILSSLPMPWQSS